MAPEPRAFTLIEILIVLSLLAAIAGLGLFASMDVYRSTDAREERDAVVGLLSRAETRAMANIGSLPHGFCYDAPGASYVLFEGAYALKTVEETVPKGKGITADAPACGSGKEILFTQLSGTTTSATITLSGGAASSTISVNEEGTIDW